MLPARYWPRTTIPGDVGSAKKDEGFATLLTFHRAPNRRHHWTAVPWQPRKAIAQEMVLNAYLERTAVVIVGAAFFNAQIFCNSNLYARKSGSRRQSGSKSELTKSKCH
jgi:hypothetical protein